MENLGKRVFKPAVIKEIIRGLCKLGPLTNLELAKILGRNPKHIKDQYLYEMVKNKELEYTHPENTAHPQQAYKAKGH
ncbi:hypothetical protein [Candidatus Neptunochlamydia vexilliferae]|uniref:Transcriptional regulator n=1 Tax=Candidatus Neptunichlamydia vexilliferae TaxID=1651774 RepID=A0ABS0AZB5_9BACT|nr:hypothetical protein [Candidatus Neptunochlamydia vexilliferae]MBF5058821.1 hypothetical protein [Candidatus Neptunochlamydia vexilliferae]